MKGICSAFVLMVCCLLLSFSGLAEAVKLPIDESPGMPFDRSFTVDGQIYDDPTIHVTWKRVENRDTVYNCNYYVAYVTIADASQLRTAACDGFGSYHIGNPAYLAKTVNAVLAVNGDFYSYHGDGYTLRQGRVIREEIVRRMDLLLIDEEGDFHVIFYDEDQENIDKTHWEGRRVINAFAFGPALIVNDENVLHREADPAFRDAPERGYRTALVQTGHLEYMIVTARDVGCTLDEMVSLVGELSDHVEVAYLLDGGESSQLMFLGGLINKVSRKYRAISDIVYFASAWRAE